MLQDQLNGKQACSKHCTKQNSGYKDQALIECTRATNELAFPTRQRKFSIQLGQDSRLNWLSENNVSVSLATNPVLVRIKLANIMHVDSLQSSSPWGFCAQIPRPARTISRQFIHKVQGWVKHFPTFRDFPNWQDSTTGLSPQRWDCALSSPGSYVRKLWGNPLVFVLLAKECALLCHQRSAIRMQLGRDESENDWDMHWWDIKLSRRNPCRRK